MHWIRHTILTWVERRFGFAVAQAYAGHQDASRGARDVLDRNLRPRRIA